MTSYHGKAVKLSLGWVGCVFCSSRHVSSRSFVRGNPIESPCQGVPYFSPSGSFGGRKRPDFYQNPTANTRINNDTLYAEFDNEYITSDLKGKNVDVFGISYKYGSNFFVLYMVVLLKQENNKLDSPRIIPINLIINGKPSNRNVAHFLTPKLQES
uniref:Enterotoxin L n=1 Tax=Staphylococcus aureus TaxID=1280 RepID=A0A140JWZ3_STAAU|nr:enterotoxin L [Staphylococcus aureus]